MIEDVTIASERSVYEKLVRMMSCRSIHWLAFVSIGIAIYSFTLSYPFVFDDRMYVLNNPLLSTPGAFDDLLNLDIFFAKHFNQLVTPDIAFSFVLRPVAYLTFCLNYLIGGQLPDSFRAFNIAVHISNSIMLYEMLRLIIRQRNEKSGSSVEITVPLFSALIFLVHPLQTESVTYIIQRFCSLGTFFYLGTMLLYLRSSITNHVIGRICVYSCSVLLLILGMLTKEIVLTAPIALVMVDTILLRRPWRNSLIRLAPHFALMSLIPLQVLHVADKVKKVGLSPKDIAGSAYSWSEYAITQLRAVLSYLRLLMLPYNQNLDPDYPLYRTLLDPEIIISICIWGIILVAAVQLLRRVERSICTDLTGFSILWFILSISISSSFIPLSDLMFEHHTYLPSLAFCTGSIAYLHHVYIQGAAVRQNALFIGLCLVVIVFGTLTVKRNLVYSSRLSIWIDTVEKSPNKARPYCWLGDVYFENHQIDQAIPYYQKTLSLNPDDVEARLQLGESYRLTNRSKIAIELYRQFLSNHPPQRRILQNLIWTYANADMIPEAIDTTKILLGVIGNKLHLLSFMVELNLRAGNMRDATYYLAQAKEADRVDTTVDMSAKLDLLERQILGAMGR